MPVGADAHLQIAKLRIGPQVVGEPLDRSAQGCGRHVSLDRDLDRVDGAGAELLLESEEALLRRRAVRERLDAWARKPEVDDRSRRGEEERERCNEADD